MLMRQNVEVYNGSFFFFLFLRYLDKVVYRISISFSRIDEIDFQILALEFINI